MTTAASGERSVAELESARPLPCDVVHKAAPEQVFVTDWMPGPGEDLCTIAARFPLAHGRFSDGAAPYYDLLLVAETVRQAGIVVASEILGMEDDRQFLLRELKVQLDPLERARRSRDNCEVLISQDPSSEVKMRPGRSMAGGLMRARVAIGGHLAGSCEVTGAWVPEEFYAGLRGGKVDKDSGQGLPGPSRRGEVEELVGKLNPANSVLTPLRRGGARSYEASLVIEPDEPTFFDHPLDHVPGLYLLEGMQQVATAAACRELGADHSELFVAGFQVRFSRIAEFQPDVACSAVLDEDCRGATVACSQGGKVCCEGTVTIGHLP
jgi:3-hydroxymyristoyl/3-hydroxydecanoyl-(acyl carrier protein) dehydratase